MFARSTNPGNSRASERGTGSRYGSHAFLFFNQSNAKEGSPAATNNNEKNYSFMFQCTLFGYAFAIDNPIGP